MLALARKNTQTYRDVTSLDNVEFRLGEIEHLPVADASVDVVISNCVLNLSPDKPQVWREIARVLKPGGRVAVSDMALLQPLPQTVASTLEALVGCIAGAPLVTDTERMMREAGLAELTLTPKPEYLQTLGRMERPLYQTIASHLPEGTTPADYITSLDISARKSF
jgi:arsenite methyltransferase